MAHLRVCERRPGTTQDDDVVDLCGGSDKDDDSVIDLVLGDDGASTPRTCEHAVRVHFGMSGSLKVGEDPRLRRAGFALRLRRRRTLQVFNTGEYGGVHAVRDVAKVREKVFHAHELGRLLRRLRSGGGGGAALCGARNGQNDRGRRHGPERFAGHGQHYQERGAP